MTAPALSATLTAHANALESESEWERDTDQSGFIVQLRDRGRKWTHSIWGIKKRGCSSIISNRASDREACLLPMFPCIAKKVGIWQEIWKGLSFLPKLRQKRAENIWRCRSQMEELETHSWFRCRWVGSRPSIFPSIHSIHLCVIDLEENSVAWNWAAACQCHPRLLWRHTVFWILGISYMRGGLYCHFLCGAR